MPQRNYFSRETFPRDLSAGFVVFLVAIPTCLGMAQAAGTASGIHIPLISGVLAGIIGGVVVGMLSKSHASISGPTAGLTAIITGQMVELGSFEAFLAAVVIAGAVQVALGAIRAGLLADFFPSAVIKGLLTAIGINLILKQIPHLLGHDFDPEGDMSFWQPDERNTFSEILAIADDLHWGSAAIGLVCLTLIIFWDRNKTRANWLFVGPLAVIAVGIGLAELFRGLDEKWAIAANHVIEMPLTGSTFHQPKLSAFQLPVVWQAGLLLGLVASLETALNLQAIDNLDKFARNSPVSRELVAQGIGNILGGFIGALPVTAAIDRSAVNINVGGRTRVSAIVHGLLMVLAITLLPAWINRIPLACIAPILILVGFKLTSPILFREMYAKGWSQFIPFVFTVVAIFFTNLLWGILAGLAVSLAFILWSNARQPIRRLMEKHVDAEVLHLELANQVSFLNKAAICQALDSVPEGGHILIDARSTDYIDPDILDLFHEFEAKTAPSRKIHVSLQGFQERYRLSDRIQYVDHPTRELQKKMTPQQVLQLLKEGHKRFLSGKRLHRHLPRVVEATAGGQFPLAAILSCIDSRSPAEIVFDLGVGDVFSVRIAGNVAPDDVLGSLEYACAVAGSKLILVLGHSRCGAVTAAVNHLLSGENVVDTTGCTNLGGLIGEIQKSIDGFPINNAIEERSVLVEEAAYRNIMRVIRTIRENSPTLAKLEAEGQIAIVGAKYDVASARIDFLPTPEMIGVLSLTRA